MLIRSIASLAGAAVIIGAAALTMSSPANALSMKECSVKYKAAKESGTLGSMKWNDFRKTECEADDAAAAPAAPAVQPATKSAAPAAAAAAGAGVGSALGMIECGAKYETAKAAGALNGMTWNSFRKAECGPGADPVALTTDGNKEPPAPTMTAPQGVIFPSAVSPQYATQKPGKARMHTCLDQYHALKANNALGGLKWIQKGGGFYSLCNAKLKGTS
ncbi:antifreeze protein [Phyllobacterium salinisoli]|uniref:Antifreeze protein n=1 Tax=Phyllobacterium salinisoli TaxID=1899321 RepID=A0A368K226_9HYPH|nr:antifreeze protein [Phyllobacterium salinisoli]RCS23251.1 antifreeze protein [Phyllobacterium salinisoli]